MKMERPRSTGQKMVTSFFLRNVHVTIITLQTQ